MLNQKKSPYSTFSGRKIVKVESLFKIDGELLWDEIYKKKEVINNVQNDNQQLKVKIAQLEKQVKSYEATILENDRWKRFQKFIVDGECNMGQDTLIINFKRDLKEKDKIIAKLTEELSHLKKQSKVTKLHELEIQSQQDFQYTLQMMALLNNQEQLQQENQDKKYNSCKIQPQRIIKPTLNLPKKIEDQPKLKTVQKIQKEDQFPRKRHLTQSNIKQSTEEIQLLRKTSLNENIQVKTEQIDYEGFQKDLMSCIQKSKENKQFLEQQNIIKDKEKVINELQSKNSNFSYQLKNYKIQTASQQKNINQQEKVIDKLSQDNIQLKNNKDELNLLIKDKVDRITALETQLTTLKTEKQQLQQLFDQHSKQNQVSELQFNQNQQQNDLHQQRLKQLNDEIAELKNLNQQELEKNKKLQEEYNFLKENNQQVQIQFNLITEEMNVVKQELNMLNQKNKELIQENQQLQANSTLNNEVEQLKNQNQQQQLSYDQKIDEFLNQIQKQSLFIDQLEILFQQERSKNLEQNHSNQELINNNKLMDEKIQHLEQENIELGLKVQYYQNEDKEINLNVKTCQNQQYKSFKVKLRYTILDLFQHLKFIGYHNSSALNIVFVLPSSRIRYANTEWHKKLLDIVTEAEINQEINVEFQEL